MKKNSAFIRFFIFSIILFSHITLTSCSGKTVIKEYSRADAVLGTVCTVRILTEKPEAEALSILKAVFTELKRLENIFNANGNSHNAENTSDMSELEKVNNLAGIKPVEISDELYVLVKTALFFAEKTDGAFNPAIGPLVKLWNIGFDNQEFDGKKKSRVPTQDEIKSVLPLLNYRDIILQKNTIFLQKKGMRLDLGGIAKGYAADKTAEMLKKAGITKALIDLGGNISTLGTNKKNEHWKIGIRNPNIGKTNSVMTVALSNTSLVTSGNYERNFKENGMLYHHILDGKTGYPVKTNLNAVSITCEKSVYADALSTASFVLGIEKTQLLLQSLPEVNTAVFFFFNGNKIVTLPDNHKNNIPFEITDPDFTY